MELLVLMRKNIVIIGLVLLIAGVAIFYAGGDLGIRGISVPQTFTEKGANQWDSSSIQISTGQLIVLTTNNSKTFLVPASDASVVTSNNITHYQINGTATTTSGVTTIEYTSLSPGAYVIVTFGAHSSKVSMIKETINTLLIKLLPILLGGVLGFVGFIVLIIGLVLRKKQLPQDPGITY